MLYFENTTGGASKFWQLILLENSTNVEKLTNVYETHWGRIGTRGSRKRKTYTGDWKLVELLQSKRHKGYRFIPERSEFITEGAAARSEDYILRSAFGARPGAEPLHSIVEKRKTKIIEKKEEVVAKRSYERKAVTRDPTLRRIDDLLEDL